MPFDIGTARSAELPNEIKPFTSAERAWLWTAACLAARRAGKPSPLEAAAPCRPETILTCLQRLYRAGRIDVVHAEVLRRWGDRGRPPPRPRRADRSDWHQWQQAMFVLDYTLRRQGIVAGFDLGPDPAPEKIFPALGLSS
ncbi:hypothetical protein [Acidiphilium acidophilum]|uniref:hypothetical protein n=1 Tax=Acidiphilium acidophilum TaxID=76588 RepID=UPI002E8E71E6|nr:hypothetical protein [Acidiphilium acidophilum]